MSAWFEFTRALRHQLRARGPHGVHSPLVFRLITEILPSSPQMRQEMEPLMELRAELLRDTRMVDAGDFGAGSRVMRDSSRAVRDVARYSSSGKRQLQCLWALARGFRPDTILELGSNLGLGTAALALGAPGARLISVEGAAELSAMAGSHLQRLGIRGPVVMRGRFMEVLPDAIRSLRPVDLAVIDGDHRYEASLELFHQILPAMSSRGIFLFDDIHWSLGMERAWDEIRQHPSSRLSIDFFSFGLIFLDPTRQVERFTLRLPR